MFCACCVQYNMAWLDLRPLVQYILPVLWMTLRFQFWPYGASFSFPSSDRIVAPECTASIPTKFCSSEKKTTICRPTSQSVAAAESSDTRPSTCDECSRQFTARIYLVGRMRVHRKWRKNKAHTSFLRETPSSCRPTHWGLCTRGKVCYLRLPCFTSESWFWM